MMLRKIVFFCLTLIAIFLFVPVLSHSTLIVVDSFDAPVGSDIHGLAFDGVDLYMASYNNGMIYQVSTSGNVLSSFNGPVSSNLTGLTFDGTHLWSTEDIAPLEIYQIDPSNGAVINDFDAPGLDSTGLTFDGTYLWNADYVGSPGLIHQIDPTTGNELASFASPGPGPSGLAFDGTYLWHSDFSENMIYQLDMSGNIIDLTISPVGGTVGLTFDGTHLWASSNPAGGGDGRIYRMAINPIPEPTTMLLFGTGIACLIGSRCRRKKK